MSKSAINQYYLNLERAIQFSKSKNEDTIKSYFWMLLNDFAHTLNYEVVREVFVMGTKGSKVKPDGILRNSFGLDIGLWESKDEKDTIDDEINIKLKKGYPFTNILFEDTKVAVLIQRGEEVMRVPVSDPEKFDRIITEFISFKNDIIYKFEEALENFKEDIPTIVETLRKKIDETGSKNKNYIAVSESFLELCKAEINPDITAADVREMMIQHILTSDIFNKIFDDPEFHRHNNIANELEKLIAVLFTYSERKNLLGSIEHYYDAISTAASSITDHHEKQKFLKVLYENFYKVYNPKAADRLGVVYTPNEIVKFMIESTNHLLEKHFGKNLADKNVEILDPATGTGTFVTSIIDSIPKKDLAYKYLNEIHANEVAILPYYVANLNVEFTFKQRMGYYEEYKNLCFVDTLDNTEALAYGGKQHNLFGLSSENSERIKRQNNKKISVIIGNPPYNANQVSENDNNKNRQYIDIDKRIKDTYVSKSKVHKTKVYDMYSRFYRWASDRIDKNGIVCFITNNSFVESRTFDGFRKCIEDEFDYAYIIDLGGNIRELSGIDGIFLNEDNTIFGRSAAVGVAIMFLVKKITKEKNSCSINYIHPCDIRATRDEKIEYLKTHGFNDIPFEKITPDSNFNWVKMSTNNFDELLPLVSGGGMKLGKSERKGESSVFDLFSFGVVTNRDDWTYDLNIDYLKNKIKFLVKHYSTERNKFAGKTFSDSELTKNIKWTQDLKRQLRHNVLIDFDQNFIVNSIYRPFTKRYLYFNKQLNWSHYKINYIFPINHNNKAIIVGGYNRKPFSTVSVNFIPNLNFYGDPAQAISLYRYDESGNRLDNITDWGLEQFVTHWKDKKIKKEDIFHYTYAVLHNPAYRKKYELNLKREFPRIPFYSDFWKWAKWGKALMELHINYEKVKPFDLKEHTIKTEFKSNNEIFRLQEPEAMYAMKEKVKVKLKVDKEAGTIELDELTTLTGVPKEAWEYKLGNRSALEWVLDQYKEKKPSDPTIAEKFNTYRFADYKVHVIDLLKRICTVSVETMKIIAEMEKEPE